MEQLKQAIKAQLKTGLPQFGIGDQVRVWSKIAEHDRVRLVPFEGVVIRRRGGGLSETFTVRRTSHGEGVERLFPIHAPVVDRIEVLSRSKVRRARLYFLRSRIGKTRFAEAERTTDTKGPEDQTPPSPS